MGIPDAALLEAVSPELLVDWTRFLVQHPTYDRNEGILARAIADRLGNGPGRERLEVSLREVAPGRENLVVRLPGEGNGPSIIFNGHLDTNPVSLGWTVDPLQGVVRDGYLFGIGVSNMKAGDAAFIAAVETLAARGPRLRGDVILTLVVGELQGGLGTKALLKEGLWADAFIVAEPTDVTVLTGHSGTFEIAVTGRGVTRHMSKRDEGVNAVELVMEAWRRLTRWEQNVVGADGPTPIRINLGSIRGGLGTDFSQRRPALVPDHCEARAAVRFPAGVTAREMLQSLRLAVADLSGVEIDFLPQTTKLVMPPFQVEREAAIVKAVEKALLRVRSGAKVGVHEPYALYGTDAGHLYAEGGMTGVVFGPGGLFNTMPDERVAIDDIVAASQTYLLTMMDFCKIA